MYHFSYVFRLLRLEQPVHGDATGREGIPCFHGRWAESGESWYAQSLEGPRLLDNNLPAVDANRL